MEEAKSLLPDTINYFDDIYAAINEVDAVIILTEWNVYRGMDLGKIREQMQGNIFIDLRNIYEPEKMKSDGFDYHCIGRQQN